MIKIIKAFALAFVITLVGIASANAQVPTSSKLEIITPAEGNIIPSNTVPILFNVENFEIADYTQHPKAAAGQGHIHLWLDDENPTAESAQKIIENTFTYSDVPYGQHTLVAQLVGNDHQPVVPEQKITVNFTNEQSTTPEANISSGFDKQTALVIFVVVALVIIAAWWYTKEEDDEEQKEDSPAGDKPKKKTVKRKTKKGKK